MTWQEPKTDWKAGDVPTSDDFNRIEGNSKELGNKTFPHIDDNTIHVTPNSNITGSTPPNSIPNGIFLTHASSASTFEGTGRAGNVITSSTNGYVIQIFVGNDNKIMTRRGSGSTWGAWQKGGEVESVNGKKGNVTLTADDITLENNQSIFDALSSVSLNPNWRQIKVSPNGSDISGDGTSAKPFKTIKKAVEATRQLSVGTVTISIDNGTYDEDIDISRISVPMLQILGYDIIVNNIFIDGFVGNLRIRGITTNGLTGIKISDCSWVTLDNCKTSHKFSRFFMDKIGAVFLNSCEVDSSYTGFIISNCFAICTGCSGSASEKAYNASGSVLIVRNNKVTSPKLYDASESGQIFTTSKVHS
jgi:hypothetical protein